MRGVVDPADSLLGEPIRMSVRDAVPGCPVTLRLSSHVADGSWAQFVPRPDGSIDLGEDAPLDGTYEGVDSMGLFWSAQMFATPSGSDLSPFEWQLTATSENGEAIVTVRRRVMSEQIVRLSIRENGLVATLFHSADDGPRPGVVVLGGSEGGLPERHAAFLATKGFTTLALAYFGVEHLPSGLCQLPVESVTAGIAYLRSRRDLSAGPVALVGASKGGELALLIAATYPDLVDAVIGVVPSGAVFMGIGTGPGSFPNFYKSSWTYKSRPVPFVPLRITPAVMWACSISRRPIRLADIYEAAMVNASRLEDAVIPIERFSGPVLLLSGQEDDLWPSQRLAGIAADRLARGLRRAPYEHVSYPNCGHAASVLPYEPAVTHVPGAYMGRTLLLGGTRAGVAAAVVDGWNRVLDFLSEHLKAERH